VKFKRFTKLLKTSSATASDHRCDFELKLRFIEATNCFILPTFSHFVCFQLFLALQHFWMLHLVEMDGNAMLTVWLEVCDLNRSIVLYSLARFRRWHGYTLDQRQNIYWASSSNWMLHFNFRFGLRIRISNIAFDCNRFYFLESRWRIRLRVRFRIRILIYVFRCESDCEYDCESEFEFYPRLRMRLQIRLEFQFFLSIVNAIAN